jgi:non-ribosomal peptide synthetase component F
VKPNDKVVLHLPRSLDYVVALFGVLFNNSCAVPIPISSPEKRVDYIRQNSSAVICIDSGTMQEISEQDASGYKKQPVQSDDSMYVIYTSGSTGDPKGVEITHQSFSNYIFWANDFYLGKKPVHSPLFTSVGFDLTLTSLFLPLISGGTCTIYPETENEEIIDLKSVFNNEDLT